MNEHYVPTARLRFVLRTPASANSCDLNALPLRILQQWWAEPMPGYMRDIQKGEWRDVALETE